MDTVSGESELWFRPSVKTPWEKHRGICQDLNESNSIRSSSVGWSYIIFNEKASGRTRGGMSVATETGWITLLLSQRWFVCLRTGWSSQRTSILHWCSCRASVKDSVHVRAVGYGRNASAHRRHEYSPLTDREMSRLGGRLTHGVRVSWGWRFLSEPCMCVSKQSVIWECTGMIQGLASLQNKPEIYRIVGRGPKKNITDVYV